MRLWGKLTWVELKLFAREPVGLLFTFAFPVVVLVVLAGVFGNYPTVDFESARPVDYYLASYLAVVIAALSLVALAVHVATYRERGVLRRLRASSVSPPTLLGAQAVASSVLAAAGGCLLVAVGALVYDTNLPERPAIAAAGFFLATVSFLAFGFLIGTLARSARAAQAMGMLLFFPMWLLSGAGPPPRVMSDSMQALAEMLPLTYAVRAIQDPWLGKPTPLGAWAVLVALLVVSALWSLRLIRRV